MITILCTNIIITRLIISTTRNTIYRVIWLIIAFINAALLLTILEIEFLAILIIIVYVGAIAILFLFAIMMLNLDSKIIIQEKTNFIPIRILLITTLILKTIEQRNNNKTTTTIKIENENSLERIRTLIYSNYRSWFFIRGIILLISMIATIRIINKERKTHVKQQLFKQLQRKYNT